MYSTTEQSRHTRLAQWDKFSGIAREELVGAHALGRRPWGVHQHTFAVI